MSEKPKKVCVFYMGGHAFAEDPGDNGPLVLPSDERITEIVEKEIAPKLLKNDIVLDFKILDHKDVTGANLSEKDWNKVGERIAEEYRSYDGFVVMQGANTIPFAAAHLAFATENLGKPIIFADVPVSRGSKRIRPDQSLLTSAQFAAYSQVPEIMVLSGTEKLIRGIDAIEVSAQGYGTFAARNGHVIGEAGQELTLNPRYQRPAPEGEFGFYPSDSNFSIHVEAVNPAATTLPYALKGEGTEGVIIVAYGAGGMPLQQKGFSESLQQAKDRKIPVIAVTDCVDGGIDFNHVARGQDILDFGVISGGTMTTAAVRAKLSFLLSKQTPYDQIPVKMAENMVGELDSAPTVLAVPGESSGLKTAAKPAANLK